MTDINAKLLAAGFTQAEIDAPADNDTLLLGLVGDGVTLDQLVDFHLHFADVRRWGLAYCRTKYDGRMVWREGKYIVANKS